MTRVISTTDFNNWINKLKDLRSKQRIIRRLDRLADGNPGDVRPVGGGVSELRMPFGPGYRVYYLHEGSTLILLLCGGDKSSQQQGHRPGTDTRHQVADRTRKEGQQ
jgi:putative addiction module killer protein